MLAPQDPWGGGFVQNEGVSAGFIGCDGGTSEEDPGNDSCGAGGRAMGEEDDEEEEGSSSLTGHTNTATVLR